MRAGFQKVHPNGRALEALFVFNLPFGSTNVTGAIGHMDSAEAFTSASRLVSILVFLLIVLLSRMPLAIKVSCKKDPR